MPAASATRDLYAFFGVPADADPTVLRRAYRTLARRHHPDLRGGSSERMAALNVAWSILGNPRKRQAYDRLRAREGMTDPVPESPYSAARATPVRVPPPPGPSSGSKLDFGRYAGWSLGQIARQDQDYLLWFARTPIGRRYQGEVAAVLGQQPASIVNAVPVRRRRRFFAMR